MPTILLIDGHSQAYRAFFGVKTPLSTRDGEPTAAVYGFIRKLLSVLKEYKPEQVAVAFDSGDTWRHAEFADYKATRDSMPDEMRTQIIRIEQILHAFNIPVITYPNYEADDILGTLAARAAENGTDVLILSGDRDMFQLITNRVHILYTKGGPNPETVRYGPNELQERYHLTPDQFVDLKALTGDTSDNIPGVTGVGEKTAIKFLTQYDSVDNLYTHLDEVSGPKTRQNLIDAKKQVEVNRHLMTIVTDLDIAYDAKSCRVRDYDPSAVTKLFNELEFRSLLKELPDSENSPPEQAENDDAGQMGLFAGEGSAPQGQPDSPGTTLPARYLCVQDTQTLQQLLQALQHADRISFDVETTGTDAMQARLVGLGMAWAAEQAAYIPVAHAAGEQLPLAQVRTALQPFFADPAIPKIAHNGKYDLTICRRHGLKIDGPIYDTMVMAWILDPSSRSLGLKAQAAIELGWEMTEITDLIGSGRKQTTMDQAPIEQTGAYCGADVDATIRLYDILAPRLHETGMWQLYTNVELPLLPVLTDMEMAGVLLDTDFLQEMSERLSQRLGELEASSIQDRRPRI